MAASLVETIQFLSFALLSYAPRHQILFIDPNKDGVGPRNKIICDGFLKIINAQETKFPIDSTKKLN